MLECFILSLLSPMVPFSFVAGAVIIRTAPELSKRVFARRALVEGTGFSSWGRFLEFVFGAFLLTAPEARPEGSCFDSCPELE